MFKAGDKVVVARIIIEETDTETLHADDILELVSHLGRVGTVVRPAKDLYNRWVTIGLDAGPVFYNTKYFKDSELEPAD